MAPSSLYADRRARLAAQLGAGGIAIIPTAPERPRNRDNQYLYRHDSYFYYLTGFGEPNACLVLTGDGHSTLFCQPKDRSAKSGTATAWARRPRPRRWAWMRPIRLPSWTRACRACSKTAPASGIRLPRIRGLAARVEGWLAAVRARARYGALCPAAQNDVCTLLDEMRLFKDAHEQATMRRAAQISARGHVRAMQRAARMLRAGEDAREYHLEAELLHEFRQQGAQYPAYDAIVAAGANACVLHYRASDAPLRAGELVLIDAGCELDGYASDITRTFPADGKFTGPQRALYDLVLASQEAAVAATRPGARFDAPHEATVAVLAQGLLDLGLLDKNKVGTAQDVIASRAYFAFYMHRTSHWLGMDVHDCGSYVEPGEVGQTSVRQDPLSGEAITERPSRILRPGMVLTIEPGLYVRPAPGVPEAFHHIGIRIEDDALVTAQGCELLTREVPVTPEEIEALMQGA
jgi:Xaa-Pro aminopeptidase